jgi:hypothetical protein
MSAIFFITAALVAVLVAFVVVQHLVICRLQRQLGQCLRAGNEGLTKLQEKLQERLQDEDDWWKGE